jgi:hypothetical protein
MSVEHLKQVSDHVPRSRKLTNEEFGHYLAGLIEGDGHFSVQQQLVITFNSQDISTAY